MRPFFTVLASIFLLTGCSRLKTLKSAMTPEKWLDSHPYIPMEIGFWKFILAEPSSSLIVCGLGVMILILGVYFIKTAQGHRSRLWWGIGLMTWAISTFSAGTSYQAFSYEIKCAGQAMCSWTSWWELWYMILMVASMNGIMVGISFSSAAGQLRKKLLTYAAINSIVYTLIVFIGALIPNQFMVSFEFMLLFAGPPMVVLFVINLKNYRKDKTPLDFSLIIAWILMAVVVAAYFFFLISGVAEALWANGIWFNANDVLHVALIFWMVYIGVAVGPKTRDVPA